MCSMQTVSRPRARKGFGIVILKGVATEFAHVTWKEVLAVLDRDRDRKDGWSLEGHVSKYVPVLERYRRAGFSPDDFGHVRGAREALADALMRTKLDLESNPLDADGNEARRFKRHLELEAEQKRIRDEVLRRLEWELWP